MIHVLYMRDSFLLAETASKYHTKPETRLIGRNSHSGTRNVNDCVLVEQRVKAKGPGRALKL